MKLIIYLVIILLLNIKSITGQSCPCTDTTLCEPVSVELGSRKEFLGFAVNDTHYSYYDWSILTTIGIFYDTFQDELLCIAHQNKVRLVYGAMFPIDQLGNYTAEQEWITMWLNKVESTFADGLNFDVEDPITNPKIALLYTQLVKNTNYAFKSSNPNYQISVDVAWDASNCIDERCYDYVGLADSSDFLVVMDYDMQSRVYNVKPCIAMANSPPNLVLGGMLNFTKLGISENKLVMGLPWYGYDYECTNDNITLSTFECVIPVSSYLGCNCSDAAGNEINYSIIMDMFNGSFVQHGDIVWDSNFESPYYNFINPITGKQHQMWFDDPKSLTIKVNIAKKLQLFGVAVWNIDQLWQNQELSSGMWGALGSFFEQQQTN